MFKRSFAAQAIFSPLFCPFVVSRSVDKNEIKRNTPLIDSFFSHFSLACAQKKFSTLFIAKFLPSLKIHKLPSKSTFFHDL
jgi:hypothetical protein